MLSRPTECVSGHVKGEVLAGDLAAHRLSFWAAGDDGPGGLAETSEKLMGFEMQQPARAGRMSAAEFRAFQERRPNHERWELIAGIPMMMVPPTVAHNRIAGNLERLLNDPLTAQDATRLASQHLGV